MFELLGLLFGGLFRLAPEIFKWLDRKDERKHELGMLDKQMMADRMRAELAIKQIEAEAEVVLGRAELDAIIAATKAQGQRSGVRWVDALNSLIRPLITIWWVIILYTAAMTTQFYALVWVYDSNMVTALLTVFGPAEKSIASSIISFWFVDRALRRPSAIR